MVALKHALILSALAVLALGCQDHLYSLEDNPAPLAHVRVKVTGDLEALRPVGTLTETPRLRVALVWGTQFQSDSICQSALLPSDPSSTALAKVGCRDPLGFVPQLVAGNVAVQPGVEATMDLLTLPTAEVLVGAVDARVGYASLLVYDDRNGNGTLDLHSVQGDGGQNGGPGSSGGPGSGQNAPVDAKIKQDFVYGASFLTMSQAHQRVAFREGDFLTSLFYPFQGCKPPKAFSVLAVDALSVALELDKDGKPQVTPLYGACTPSTLEAAVVEIAMQPTETVRDVACRAGGGQSGTRYRAPPELEHLRPGQAPGKPPDLKQPYVCKPVKRAKPKAGQPDASQLPLDVELVLASPPADCKSLTHYTLRGCTNDVYCVPKQGEYWDHTKQVPTWWPCPLTAPASGKGPGKP